MNIQQQENNLKKIDEQLIKLEVIAQKLEKETPMTSCMLFGIFCQIKNSLKCMKSIN